MAEYNTKPVKVQLAGRYPLAFSRHQTTILSIMSDRTASIPLYFSPRRLSGQVAVATLGRLFINTSRRLIYPFAPALSRGLGVPLTSITSLIALNQAAGLLSPLFGPLGDRWGYRLMLLAGLGLLTVGMIAAGLLPFYGVLLLAVFLAGLGKSIFDPALQAYVGERVPYHRRGLVIGVIEFSWAGTSLIGIPLIGLLIDRWGWQSPFLVLGGLGLLSLAALALAMPADGHGRSEARPAGPVWVGWRLLSRERAALGALGFILLTALANDNLFVVYGVWLEEKFALSVVALGTATTAIGLAELLGEGLTASIADRLGLKRVILIGQGLSSLSYALLPLLGRSLPLALGGLFFTFLTFEFTVVTSFSLFTEILPRARGTLMSSLLAAAGVGRVVGALCGGPLWLSGGLTAVGLVSAAASALALVCLGWGLWRWRDHSVDI
ncbi:MAG: MFS transporter [Chloroflexota bacterium]